MAYTVSQRNELWDITANTSGADGTVNTGRGYHIGTSSTTLTTLAPGRTIPNSVNAPVSGTNINGVNFLGNFATMTPGSYVMKRVTTTLAGLSNTFLRSGGTYASGRRSINKIESVRTTQVASSIRAGNWNIFTGTFSSAPSTSEDAQTPSANNAFNAFDMQNGQGATSGILDAAANPSMEVPGELTIHHGSGAPTLFDYKARTTWG